MNHNDTAVRVGIERRESAISPRLLRKRESGTAEGCSKIDSNGQYKCHGLLACEIGRLDAACSLDEVNRVRGSEQEMKHLVSWQSVLQRSIESALFQGHQPVKAVKFVPKQAIQYPGLSGTFSSELA